MGLVATTLVAGFDTMIAPTKVIASEGDLTIFQQFEHGFMLGIGGYVQVFPYNDKDRLSLAFSSDEISALTENAIANVPPQGDYQPTGNFGKLWSNSLDIMQGVGWAITPPIQYTAIGSAASGIYIPLPMSKFSVRLNDPGIPQPYPLRLLNGTTLQAQQWLWGYIDGAYLVTTDRTCDPQRIQFQPGSYLGMVSGYLGPSCKDAVFLVKATAQQRMTVISVVHQGLPITGKVVTFDGSEIQTLRNEMVYDGVLPVTGDYSIHLFQDSSEPVPIFQDKYGSEQTSSYALVVVIR